jgi:hypothetical protein
MNRTFTGAAAVAALALTGLSAHAGCTDPRAPAQQYAFQKMSPIVLQHLAAANRSEHESAAENIVGTWHVIYTAGGSPFGEAFIQWVESTTGAVLVGASQLFAAPFVWRCRNRGTVNPFPVAAHRTGHAGPHPALGQDLRPSFSESHARSLVSSTRPSVSWR